MLVEVCNRCSDFDSYRAARVKSLFNAESGANFALDAELPIEEDDWRISIIVGPSGGGNSLLGRLVFGDEHVYREPEWPEDAPIIDAIAPGNDFNDVTAALAAVGLGDVPAWLRPYAVLSNGEQFRATLGRVIADAPERVVIDEFTSVVDRQIAKFGALAFQKGMAADKGAGRASYAALRRPGVGRARLDSRHRHADFRPEAPSTTRLRPPGLGDRLALLAGL